MKFLNRIASAALIATLLAMSLSSCEEDLTTIGSGLVSQEPFLTDKAFFDVFAYNRKINAVQTNQMPAYQLGNFIDPVYGRTEARITSQVSLPGNAPNPVFGTFSQQTENNSATDDNILTIPENETVTDVILYIPFLRNTLADSDGDGVDDEFDIDPLDPNSDTDGDGLTDNQERILGTNPLNPDTDGDGIIDSEDPSPGTNNFPRKFQLDSIFGNQNIPFRLKVERNNFFLRDLDPNSNFQELQAYFSNQQFTPEFAGEVLFDGEVTIDNEEILQFNEDDPETPDVDESLVVLTRLAPGIQVPLDPDFFQQNILDKEGSTELLSVSNFEDFFRGIHLSVPDDILLLFDLTQATININYEHDRVDTNGTVADVSDDTIVKDSKTFQLRLITGGPNIPVSKNAVNTFINETYPPQILDQLNTGQNASRIYVKGGAGSFAEIKLFDESNGFNIINQIKANNWVINEANLVFYVDRNALDAAGSPIEPPRLYLYNTENNNPLYVTRFNSIDPNSSLRSFPDHDGLLQKTGDKGTKYRIRITEHINDLVVRDSANATLGLVVTSDIRVISVREAMLSASEDKELPVMNTINPFGTVLFGSNVAPAEEDKKLRLEISYTKAN
ncbi:DUF4270 family protein [Arenibacter sp. GZD96]|uniref:DUF4270 domain-containing protein n=1 Tax=Aurantibrevibacter litoralis TaxID=3106030 RepID=UPI002AFE2199|nr:DUF4270 family protein [Arenibacter sp. GZD-96]MEA1785645.1 DUF4270 family protein [Arenibacter sp. GZD-96]